MEEYDKARQYCRMAADLVESRHLLRYRQETAALCDRIEAERPAEPGE
jgi:hypothetical protein